jgi:hypothetical protein
MPCESVSREARLKENRHINIVEGPLCDEGTMDVGKYHILLTPQEGAQGADGGLSLSVRGSE